MTFANPWGLLGLLALPAIVILHLYYRRFPPLPIGGLHLWGVQAQVRQAGRRRERLPITASLLLELLAAAVLSLVLAQPHLAESRQVEHLIVVLDNSASMQARPPGKKSFRDAAIEEIANRFQKLPSGSVATLIVTGRRPELLTGPATSLAKTRTALDAWNPGAVAHDFEPAWDLASQLAETSGRILFVTNHLPPKQSPTPKAMEIVSLGQPLENTAITAARWIFDPKTKQGRVFLRIANFGKKPADVQVRGRHGDQQLLAKTLSLSAGADASLETDVRGGLGDLAVETSSPADGLDIDNHVTLIEPKVRTVTIALSLPADHAALRPVRRALAGITQTQFGPPAEAQLLIGPANARPPSQPGLTSLGIGPIDPSDAARKQAKDIIGPYLLEKRHPLLDGVVLGGVVFGGVQPVTLEATPLVSAGKQLLLCRPTETRTTAYLLNLDFARSNLAESPDWPILVKNLVEICRDGLPGLKRWNYRLNEEITFRPDSADHSGGADRLTLAFGGKTQPLARGPVVEIPPLQQTGIYEVRDGDRSIGRFAVNFHDPVESNLSTLGPGLRDAVSERPALAYRLDDPFSWLIASGIAIILAAVLADWLVLDRTARARRVPK
jgi:Ca-activated chloride channel homolog